MLKGFAYVSLWSGYHIYLKSKWTVTPTSGLKLKKTEQKWQFALRPASKSTLLTQWCRYRHVDVSQKLKTMTHHRLGHNRRQSHRGQRGQLTTGVVIMNESICRLHPSSSHLWGWHSLPIFSPLSSWNIRYLVFGAETVASLYEIDSC